jgi:seryl-tRNA synthetase
MRQDRIARRSLQKQETETREKEIAAHVEEWTKLNDHIDQMQLKIDKIDRTIGNGVAGSIKDQIKDLQTSCAANMATLNNQVLSVNTPRITRLEERVNGLEKGQ